MIYVTIIRIVLWIFMGFVEITYLPLRVIRLFQSSQQCPHISDKILCLRASKLAQEIRKKQISSESVIKAYISRILEVNPIINAVIEERFEAALADARNADNFVATSNLSEEELAGRFPLLGVPITVKGSIAVAGMRNTAGRPDRHFNAEDDAAAVKRARAAGAIPILTSNTPELCLNWETTNKLIGRTNNPYNSSRTVGGSSGGETALLASGGSVLGIGSDIAGSLRLPAHFCGVWGHKPSPLIVSPDGHYPDCEIREKWNKVFTLGPLARYATDLRLLLSVIAEPEQKKQLNLNKTVNMKNINVYYVHDMNSMLAGKATSDATGAVKKVVEYFNDVCSTPCTKVKIPLLDFASELSFLSLLQIEKIENLFEGKGEGCYSELLRYLSCRSQHMITSIMYGVLRRNLSWFSASKLEKNENAVNDLRNVFIDMLGTDGVFICPSFASEANHHGDAIRNVFQYGRLSIFNALGLPATNCPITVSRNGLPLSIQVVGAPNCDYLTLSVAEELERRFGGWTPPSLIS